MSTNVSKYIKVLPLLIFHCFKGKEYLFKRNPTSNVKKNYIYIISNYEHKPLIYLKDTALFL